MIKACLSNFVSNWLKIFFFSFLIERCRLIGFLTGGWNEIISQKKELMAKIVGEIVFRRGNNEMGNQARLEKKKNCQHCSQKAGNSISWFESNANSCNHLVSRNTFHSSICLFLILPKLWSLLEPLTATVHQCSSTRRLLSWINQ